MIHKYAPRVIDYQGMRIGPPAYDIASILWDPYYPLDDNIRERLLEYYINRMTSFHSPIHPFTHSPIDPETLTICRLQRHMQALGAYGFLSAVKGKRYFLEAYP